jgi:arylsulfatase A-like enzyme
MKYSRINFFTSITLFSLAVLVLCQAGDLYCQERQIDSAKPNILFIAIDDLNDWIGPLGGHPQAQTPNLDRFAREAVNFTNNYCASPGCNPSRTAVMTGLHTYNSGMYSNYQYWRKAIPNAKTMGEYFREHGYWSGGAGKIFHYDQVAPECWDAYYPSQKKNMPDHYYPKPGETVNMPAFKYMYGDFDWSPIPLSDEETGDYKSVNWVSEQLQKEQDQPFFLACGIYRPHLPWYVPQKYFDMYPLESVQLPKVLENDLDDVGERARELASRAGNYHKHVIEAGQWEKAVQGYLASITFADAMVGRLLDALENSNQSSNTIVVLWSDHGWQLGEKQHWRKFALWDNLARTVLMIKAPKGTTGLPEGTQNGARSKRVTSLVDLYPTLLELCGLPEKQDLDGRSLVPLLKNSKAPWNYPAITTYDFGEFSVRTENWRYIRYIDDSEELYDHRNDPEEWTNLSGDPQYRTVKEKMARYVPANPVPLREDTLIELMPHHTPPIMSKEDYQMKHER